MKQIIFFLLLSVTLFAQTNLNKGNVIFLHPDGTGLNAYNAMRILYFGPDGTSNWDRLTNIGLYRGHMEDALTASSNSGATVHAYGVKVKLNAFGLNNDEKIVARSGKKMSIMEEAISKGIKTGLINSGSIVEPGSACFVTGVSRRNQFEEITKQMIDSGVDVILSGGEKWFLPNGTKGFHGEGVRSDNINLIEVAREKGYYIVYTKDELQKIPSSATKLLGIFAEESTFNDVKEEEQKAKNLPNYNPTSPSIAEMLNVAIKFLSKEKKQFFIVAEEEGTDNFSNENNAQATLEALKRADDAIGVALDFYKKNKNTLILTAADSDAGGLSLLGETEIGFPYGKILPARDKNGAPIDGVAGTETVPFKSAPDKTGRQFPFAISWSTFSDQSGGIVSRAIGLNSNLMNGSIDNTDIYKIMYATLFGKLLK
ncbi:MAG: alkaline phosphatase [Chlorobiaceae bacterium]|nr:alkaline phosphatase [Chlorobiaceae bacterium]MBA4309016.1 alkaline phosphatase [Chlorobiaceae bacterium]